MAYYNLSPEQALKETGGRKSGFTESEAESRLKEYGENVLREKKKKSAFVMYIEQFKDFMTVLLMISAFISAVISFITKDKSEIVDTMILVFIILLNNTVGFIQQYRADHAIEKMKELSKSYTKVLRSGKVCSVESRYLVPGDVVFFEEGDKVTADCRLLESKGVIVNESSLTGESAQVAKSDCAIFSDAPLAERKNMLYSSTFITKGNASAVVVGTGMNTEIGKIAKLIDGAETVPTPLEKALDKLGKVISYIVVGIALFIFVFGSLLKRADFLQNFMNSVAISVAAIPEGLPAVVTVLMALGVQRMSAQRAIIRKLQAVETLGGCEVICSDKTGTLTENKMSVSETQFFGNDERVVACMRICNTVKNPSTGDETELALVNYAASLSVKQTKLEKTDEIPFDSERKMMSVLVREGNKKVVYAKGGVEVLLKKCAYFAENGKTYPLTEERRAKILSLSSAMAKNALRVLGFAYRDYDGVFDERELIFIGFCGMFDPPKKSAFSAVKSCKDAGITMIMITGDQKDTALAIAKRLKIASCENEVVTGDELDALGGEDRRRKILSSRVFARVCPEHKGMIVEAFQREGKTVAMTGDGVNDAPALKRADIGVAMGSGTDVSKNVSDMVVADDDFSTIVTAVAEGRRIFSNIRKTVAFYLATNLGEVLSILVVAFFFPRAIFLTSTQLLWINLITDSFPVLALGAEKAEKDLMTRKPERAERKIFSAEFFVPVVIFGILQAITTVSVFLVCTDLFGNGIGRSAAMLSMSFSELFYAFTVRTERVGVFGKNFFENKILILTVSIASVLGILLCSVPFLANIFSLETLSFKMIGALFLTSFAVVPIGEIYKLAVRKKLKKNKKSLKKYEKTLDNIIFIGYND